MVIKMTWVNILKFGPQEKPRRSWESKEAWKERISDSDTDFEVRWKKAKAGLDNVIHDIMIRFEGGNPVRLIAMNTMMKLEKQLLAAKTVEDITTLSGDLRHHLMTFLNNLFDNPFGASYDVDIWLKENGFIGDEE